MSADARFATLDVDDVDQLVEDKDSKNTKIAIKHSVKILRDYLVAKNQSPQFEALEKEELAKVLALFWANTRRKDGTMYKTKSMQRLKFGIVRHVQEKLGVDINRDPAFLRCNQVYKAVGTDLKRKGFGGVVHSQVVVPEDMQKLYVSGERWFNSETPSGLQNKVWFDLTFHLCRRGQENQRWQTKESYAVQKDGKGFEYVYQSKDEMLKNHRGDDTTVSAGRMYACPGKLHFICEIISEILNPPAIYPI